jgi:release factor glutamine methyltransferase
LPSHYKPSDDTFLLADCAQKHRGRFALEIGTGSGYICGILKTGFKFVVATDIDADAIKVAREYVKGIRRKDGRPVKDVAFVCCDSSSAISNMRFDLIVINPPYLPSGAVGDITVDGGTEGIEVSIHMMEDCVRLLEANGILLIATSSLSNYRALMERMDALGISAVIIAGKKFEFEELIVIQGTFKLRVLPLRQDP